MTKTKQPIQSKQQPLSTVHTQRNISVYQGPLPPADELKKYEELLPGAADRIIALTENQQSHRIKTTELIVSKSLRNEITGQWMAFILGTIAIISGSLTATFGSPLAGGFIGTGGVAGLCAVFIYGTRTKKHTKPSEEV